MYQDDYLMHYGVLGMKWGRRIANQKEHAADLIRSGKAHQSIGFGKTRQKAYDERDARRLEKSASNIRSKMDQEATKDLSKFKAAGVKAAEAANKAMAFRKAHTFKTSDLGPNISEVYMDDPRLVRKAEKADAKVNRLMAKLNKKYENKVSATFKHDVETGKMYVDLMLDSKTDRVNIN